MSVPGKYNKERRLLLSDIRYSPEEESFTSYCWNIESISTTAMLAHGTMRGHCLHHCCGPLSPQGGFYRERKCCALKGLSTLSSTVDEPKWQNRSFVLFVIWSPRSSSLVAEEASSDPSLSEADARVREVEQKRKQRRLVGKLRSRWVLMLRQSVTDYWGKARAHGPGANNNPWTSALLWLFFVKFFCFWNSGVKAIAKMLHDYKILWMYCTLVNH